MVAEQHDVYEKMKTGFVETSSGTHFSLDNPEFYPNDIAHALSMNCRFNGHTSEFYSVAEHSMLVSAIVYFLGGSNEQKLEGLLHDATEAYLSDVPAPFKQFLPDWKKLDHELDLKFRDWAGLPAEKDALVKKADWMALFIEAQYFIHDKGECFLDPDGLRAEALELAAEYELVPQGFDPETAKQMFLECWLELADE